MRLARAAALVLVLSGARCATVFEKPELRFRGLRVNSIGRNVGRPVRKSYWAMRSRLATRTRSGWRCSRRSGCSNRLPRK